MKYIIELYLTYQQKLLNDHMESCYEGNSWFINKANNIISLDESGSYSSDGVAINELMIAIAVLDMVINKKTTAKDDCVEEADELKIKCLERIAELKES